MNTQPDIRTVGTQFMRHGCQDEQLQQAFLAMSPQKREATMQWLKRRADALMRTDLQACLNLCDTMGTLARITGDPRHKALALLACANAQAIGAGAFERGLEAYTQAGNIYAELGMSVEQAGAVIGKLYALANLGRYQQAIAEAEWARRILRERGEWLTLARLKVNLALLYSRQGDDITALTLLDLARDAYRRLGVEGEPYWPRVEHNRALVLRNLGHFEAALQAAQVALQQHERLGQRVAAARARQNLAMTYFVMGQYNRALEMLWTARQVFEADNRPRHMLLVDFFISNCLLKLCRYDQVIERSQQAAEGLLALGNRYEAGQALALVARACIEQGKFSQALERLEQARTLMEQEDNRVALADLDLQVAELSLRQGDPARARSLAESCAAAYEAHGLPIPLGNAWRLAAQAALAQGKVDTAQAYMGHLRGIVQMYNWPGLRYPLAWLEAQLAGVRGDMPAALRAYHRALDDLERTRNALMVEHRASFLDGKLVLYQNAVALNLFLGYPLKALQVAERAKSRSLLDMLAHRLDLRVRARAPQDRALVHELISLQEERNRLWRHQVQDEPQDQDWQAAHSLQKRLLRLEKRITDLWHVLLVRNADYARDASLWQAPSTNPQQHLPEGVALLEFFAVHESLLVFVVSAERVHALVLDTPVARVQRNLQALLHNLRAVRRLPAAHTPTLEANARGILHALYRDLLQPCEMHLEGITHLQIVPHGVLHYLPLHALWDGNRYLVERFSFSYLPASSLLPYCQRSSRPSTRYTRLKLLALGHSFGGRLPRAVEEAGQVAALWGGAAMLEHRATRTNLLQSVGHHQILHLAAHGEFRSDMPLFSGIALEDGWLTALDVFNRRIPAQLVTLSACETGRSLIGAGDELHGLQRAFLASGVSSLLLSLWAVSDSVTTGLMLAFYRALRNGAGRAQALQMAQLQALRFHETAHPYYWASFVLSGDWGRL